MGVRGWGQAQVLKKIKRGLSKRKLLKLRRDMLRGKRRNEFDDIKRALHISGQPRLDVKYVAVGGRVVTSMEPDLTMIREWVARGSGRWVDMGFSLVHVVFTVQFMWFESLEFDPLVVDAYLKKDDNLRRLIKLSSTEAEKVEG